MTVYLDIETTALFDRGYTVEPIEIAYWQDGGGPARIVLPHTLVNADPDALRINRYYERHLDDPSMWDGRDALDGLRSTLVANQIAGSAPWFDERVLLGLFGLACWRSFATPRLAARRKSRDDLDPPSGAPASTTGQTRRTRPRSSAPS